MKSTTACSDAPINPVGPTTTWTTFAGLPAARWSSSTRRSPVKWSTTRIAAIEGLQYQDLPDRLAQPLPLPARA